MKKIKKYIISGLFISVLFFGSALFTKNVLADDIVPPADQLTPAQDPTPPVHQTPAPQEKISFTLRSGNQTIFSGDLPLPADGQTTLKDSDGADHSVNSRSVLAMLNQADVGSDAFNVSNLTYYSSFFSFYLKCINISDADQCDNWQYVVDDAYSQVGMDQNILKTGDTVFIYFGSPHKVSLAKSKVFVGESFSATAQNYDYKNDVWLPLTSVTLGVVQDDPENPWTPKEISTVAVDDTGTASFSISTAGDYKIGIKEDYYFPIENITVVSATASLTVRSGGSVVFSGDILLPEEGQINLKDKTETEHEVSARSVLAILELADAESDSFNISDLEYYDSFESFYLKCITSLEEQCDNWQYVVNDAYSQTGMDKFDLKAGDTLYLYYGSQHQIVLSKSLVDTNENFSTTAQNYDYKNGTWLPLTGITVGVVQDDPENPWTPKEISTVAVDDTGTASFSISTAGDYKIGIKEDYYFPTQGLTVKDPIVIIGGCGSCGLTLSPASFDVSKAISFLISKQATDGSFGNNVLYTDWGAVALGATSGYDSEKEKLKSYLIVNIDPGSNLSDYERRAMALMSLGINPYSGTSVNYIQKIIDGYDGNQFGDSSLYNDDIFALIVLENAGYSTDDPMIASSVKFIISKQKSDGSWDSIDMTSAGIQALLPIGSSDGDQAVSKAKQFLLNNQRNDGGFDNVFSTSWAMQAISAMGESSGNWTKGQNTPSSYLASKQATDGSLNADGGENAVLWATEYAIPAGLGKKWVDVMSTFTKSVIVVSTGGGCGSCISYKKIDDIHFDKKEEVKEIIEKEEDVKKEEEEKAEEKIVEVQDLPKEKILASVEPKPKQIKKNPDQKIKTIVKTEKVVIKEISETNTNKFLTASAVDALGQNTKGSSGKNSLKSLVVSIGSFFKKLFAWL